MSDQENTTTNSIKEEDSAAKRDSEEVANAESNKKIKTDSTDSAADKGDVPNIGDSSDSIAFVPPGTAGVIQINDNDVLSGRGGGTNLHPGNRQFRDLINLYRRDYLKARKNDKPAISRSIVNSIREKGGRFLKKVEKSGLWFEIGDDAAREKTSQALRQRAPEMRKLLLDHEMEGARVHQQHGMMMGMPPMPPHMMMQGMPMMMPNGSMAFNPAMMGMPPNGMFMGMPPLGFNGMPPPNGMQSPNQNPFQPPPNGMPQDQQQMGGMPGMPMGQPNDGTTGGNGESNPIGSGAPMTNMNNTVGTNANMTNPMAPSMNSNETGGVDQGTTNNINNPDMQPLNASQMSPMGMNPGQEMGQLPNMGGPESQAPVGTTAM